MFEKLLTRDIVSWTALIWGYAEYGYGVIALKHFQEALLLGLKPNRVTFLSALKACGSIAGFQYVLLVHGEICRAGMDANIMVATSLIDIYAKTSALEEAYTVFSKACHKSVAPWNAIILGYLQYGNNVMVRDILQWMEPQGIKPNKVTFLCVLKACQSVEALALGRLAHDKIIRMDLIPDVTVGNALVDMYSKCGSLEEAERAFYGLKSHSLVSWSSLIDGFIRHGQHASALENYMKMQDENIIPDEVTYSSILGACIAEGFVEQGKLIHDSIVKSKLEENLVIGSALVNMYAKIGLLLEARNVLSNLSCRNTLSWGALVAGYLYYGYPALAIQSFLSMHHEGVPPDEAAFVCAFKACAEVGDFEQGKAFHHQLITSTVNVDAQVGTALVDMYGKNSSLVDAQRSFNSLPVQDVVAWGALIGGYVFCKQFKLAIDCLKEMQQQGLMPTDVIYTSVLSSCIHTGEVAEGHLHFQHMMKDSDGKPSIENYACLINLLGRSGFIGSAKDVIHTIPMSLDQTSWALYMTSCRLYGYMVEQHHHGIIQQQREKQLEAYARKHDGNQEFYPNLDTQDSTYITPGLDVSLQEHMNT